MKRHNITRRQKLTDTVLMALEPECKDYRIADSQQLYFLVKNSGHKSWQFRYKNTLGVWTWKGLGAYPLVKASQARKIARAYLDEIEANTFLTNREEECQKYRLSSLIEEWLDTKIKDWSDKTYEKAVKSIHKHINQKFGERDFRSITAKEWFYFFQSLQRDLKIMTQVSKLFSYMNEAYEWAEISYEIKFNPLTKLKKFLDKHK